MTSNTCSQVVVSTLAEAHFYLENGFDDITYAYPLSFDKLPRCAELLNKLQLFHITVDNMEIIEALGKYVLPESCKKWSVLLMVDCGYGRGNSIGSPEKHVFILVVILLQFIITFCYKTVYSTALRIFSFFFRWSTKQ